MFKKNCIKFLIFFLTLYTHVHAADAEYRIGVLSVNLKEHTKAKWQPTADYLTKILAHTRFTIHPMNYDELNRAIQNGEIDFVLTNSAHYIIHEKRHGLFRMATVIYKEKGYNISEFGGVIATLANRDDINTLQDLVGKRIAAVKKGSLGGYQAQVKEMYNLGLPLPDSDKLVFTDMPHRKTLQMVFEGKADVAFFRTGVIENLLSEKAIDPTSIKIINPQENYPFHLSTKLYPEWPFACLKHIDLDTRKQVADALFDMEPTEKAAMTAKYAGWYIPLDYTVVTDLLKSLRLPPFDMDPKFTLQDIINKYFYYVIGFIVLTILLTIWLILVNIKLHKGKKQLVFLLKNDTLTELPNRYALNGRINEIINTHSKEEKFALIHIDLDNFKDINESYGHEIGDQAIIKISNRLKENFDTELEVFRVAGDEFVVIANQIHHASSITHIANRIIHAIKEPIILSSIHQIKLNSSLGICIYPDHGKTHTELLQNVDAALYLAKDSGKGVFAFYNNELTDRAIKRVEIGQQLQDAITNNHLQLHYQPKYDIHSGQIVGAEALIRWIKADGTTIPPNEFIPIVERSGFARLINEFVISKACKQIKLWLNLGVISKHFTVAINISTIELHSVDFIRQLQKMLLKHEIDSRYLELEITESAFIDKESETISILHDVKKLGIKLALDDFGTGYSSLSHLKHLPIDIVKIDKSFIDHITSEIQDRQIVESIIKIGNIFGYKIVAEGIETREQLECLQALNCDFYQGYFGSKPVTPKVFETLIQR